VHLESVACPDLAPIIQSGFPFDEQVVETVRAYCAPLRAAGVDTVILGSTHYPLCAPILQRMLGRQVTLISAGAGVARSVERALAARNLLNPRAVEAERLNGHGGEGSWVAGAGSEGSYRFQCTGAVQSFRELGTRFLQMPLGAVERVGLPRTMVAV
jgi:glutamate racemase